MLCINADTRTFLNCSTTLKMFALSLIKHRDCTFSINVCTNDNGTIVVTMSDFNDTDCNSTAVELYKSGIAEEPFINYKICKHNGIKIARQDSHVVFMFSTDDIMTFVTPEAYWENIFTEYHIS